MDGLHRRNDAQTCKAGDVRVGDRLDVLNPEPGVMRAVEPESAFIGVQRHLDSTVADGVGVNLKSSLVAHLDESIEFALRIGCGA